MTLKQLETILVAARIENLEAIARSISASNQSDYDLLYATEIARQKLRNSGLKVNEIHGNFPFEAEYQGLKYLVAVSPRIVVPDLNSQVQRYARSLRSASQDYEGIIQFLPFLMNGKKLRDKIEKEIRKPIAFVDLSYNSDSLERRFGEYGNNCERIIR